VKLSGGYSSLSNMMELVSDNLSFLSHLTCSHLLSLEPSCYCCPKAGALCESISPNDEASQTRWLHYALATKSYTNHLGPTIHPICPRRLGCSNSETPGQPPLSPCPPSSSLSRFLVPTSHSSPSCKYIPVFPGHSASLSRQEVRATGTDRIHCFSTRLQHVPHERQRGGGSHTCTRNASPSSLTSILLSTARDQIYAPVLRRRATTIPSDASTCDTYTAAPTSSSTAFVAPTTSRDASCASPTASSTTEIIASP
jgi:hypothetical protein